MSTSGLSGRRDASSPINASLHASSSRCVSPARPSIAAGKESTHSYTIILLHRPLILLCLEQPGQQGVIVLLLLLHLALRLLPGAAARLLGNRDLNDDVRVVGIRERQVESLGGFGTLGRHLVRAVVLVHCRVRVARESRLWSWSTADDGVRSEEKESEGMGSDLFDSRLRRSSAALVKAHSGRDGRGHCWTVG